MMGDVSEERELTRTPMLAWSDAWTAADRDLVAQALDLLPQEHLFAPPSNAYAAAWLWLPRASRKASWDALLGSAYAGSYEWLRAIVFTAGSIRFPREDFLPPAGHPLTARLVEREIAPYGIVYFVYDILLSPSRAAGERNRAEERDTPALCPSCFVAMPSMGGCDFCGT